MVALYDNMDILTGAWSAFCTFVFPRGRMEVPKPLPIILSSHRDWDTEAILSFLWDQAIASQDPMVALNMFPVTSMRFKKSKITPAEHEFLTSKVKDMDRVMGFILERTVSDILPDDAIIDRFLNHPDSKSMLHKILQSIQTIPPSAIAAASIIAVPMLAPSALPAVIIPLALSSSLEPPLPLMDEGRNTKASHLPLTSSATVLSEDSYFDQASLAMAEILQVVSDSQVGYSLSKSLNNSKPPKNARANDRILGEDWLKEEPFKSVVDLGEFQPKVLKMFHMVLLAHVVHVQYPLYVLFLSQCYWFACIVFTATQIIDRQL